MLATVENAIFDYLICLISPAFQLPSLIVVKITFFNFIFLNTAAKKCQLYLVLLLHQPGTDIYIFFFNLETWQNDNKPSKCCWK
jgi:hypothetical protein